MQRSLGTPEMRKPLSRSVLSEVQHLRRAGCARGCGGGGLPSVAPERAAQKLPLVNVLSVFLIRGGREPQRTGGRRLTLAFVCLFVF